MENKVQILLSAMNIQSEKEYNELLENNKIEGNIITVNQVEQGNNTLEIIQGTKKLYSYQEKGISKSRNRLLQLADAQIELLADDDIIYVPEYEKIIEEEYKKNRKADMIIFFVYNNNSKRERNKKIGNKKVNRFDVMKVRTYEITFNKKIMKKANVQFDVNFGPGGVFSKGEETVFVSDLLKKGIKIYSSNQKIANAGNEKSTWFTGYNEKFLYDQGAIFYRIEPKLYKLLIIQYVIRKYFLYKNNLDIIQAYKQMIMGAKKCKDILKYKEIKSLNNS